MHLKKWLKKIRDNARNGIKIVLFGNKYDLDNKREVDFKEAVRFAESNKIAYEEISAKTGFNSEKFQTVI